MSKKGENLFVLVVLSLLMLSCSSSKSSHRQAYEVSTSTSDFVGEATHFRNQEKGTENRMIAYSVELNLLVESIHETKKNLIEQVKTNNGFIVLETNNSVRTRIPAENMDNFTNNAKTLGDVERETKTGRDITDQYRDNVIRLESLKTIRNRYLGLLERAVSISEILSVEKELERINTQIELLEGQRKYAELSVEYSDINVRFEEKGEKTKPGPIGWIFVGLYHGVKWLFVWN